MADRRASNCSASRASVQVSSPAPSVWRIATALAVECCLDLANHLIADRGWPAPESYRAAFRTLAAQGVLGPDLAEEMAGWAVLRNILVHLYLDIDHQRLHAGLRDERVQLLSFAKAMQRVLDEDG